MSKAKSQVSESALRKAVKAISAAGIQVGRVDVDRDGRISVYPATVIAAEGVAAADSWADVTP